ncbi:hypothetical protein EPUS_05721 [Endocarpon pusillum Z07020]|uniref:BAH domain-containing protein n=1 Tax=Endocarpon pusillum (strain Z07020 / HMAS-L-300199) TaxID=1263415 RepID=U1HF29_ENDPU|nr:uncharacterized protein EPUS_05721 [Endocarpon pusillum Z07020]ERF68660.1 hypothetical protein EPUS_05721 [Endocarpon pusillum Z07020]
MAQLTIQALYIEGDPALCRVYFINHQDDRENQNAGFQIIDKKPFAFALQNIQKGEEIYTTYGGEWHFPEAPHSTIKPEKVPCVVNGLLYKRLVIHVNDYVYIKGQPTKGDRHTSTWIAKVLKISLTNNKEWLHVSWMYHLHDVPRCIVGELEIGDWELFASNHEDDIVVDTLMDLAKVKENCRSAQSDWYWWRTWDAKMQKLIEPSL